MAGEIELWGEAWSSAEFPPGESARRLGAITGFVGEPYAVPAELVIAAAEVGEALRAARPDGVRRAIEAWVDVVNWATVVERTEVSRFPALAIATDEPNLQRKTLLSMAQGDLIGLLRAAANAGKVDANVARDVVLWVELADADAKKRIERLFVNAGWPSMALDSRRDIALRALELLLPRSLPVEERIRRVARAPATIASLAGVELAAETGAHRQLHRVGRTNGIEAPSYAAEARRPLLLAAFAHRPALFHEVLGVVVTDPNVATHRAIAMTDGIAWTVDVEVRSATGFARFRQHGPAVLGWSGTLGKSGGAPADVRGALKFERAASDEAGAALAEAWIEEHEKKLGARRAAPSAHLPKPSKRTSIRKHLEEASWAHDRGALREWVAAGVDLNPICEEPWDHPPLYDVASDPESLSFFLANGADPHGKDVAGSGILDLAASQRDPDFLESAEILLGAGAELSDKGFRSAAEAGSVELLELLSRRGIRPRRVAELLDVAKKKRHHATIAFLSALG